MAHSKKNCSGAGGVLRKVCRVQWAGSPRRPGLRKILSRFDAAGLPKNFGGHVISDPCYPLPRPCPQLSHLQVETRSNKNPLHFWREGQCKAAPFATETRKLQLLCKQDKVLFYRTLLDKSLLRRDANGTVLWRGGTPVCIRIPDEASLKEKARGIFVQLGLNLLESRSTLVRGESCGSIAADFSAMGLHVDPNCGAVTPHSPRPGNEVRDKEIYKHLQAVYKTHLAPRVHDFAAVWFADRPDQSGSNRRHAGSFARPDVDAATTAAQSA